MDNLHKGRTITIKLNGDKPPFQEPKDNEESIPFEEANHEAVLETAVAQEAEDTFDWILPSNEGVPEVEEYQVVSQTDKTVKNKSKNTLSQALKHSKGKRVNSILLAVFFAVVLGMSLGVIMLKLVITDQTASEPAVEMVEKENSIVPSTEGKTGFQLPSLTTYIIQEGIYSTKESAKEAEKLAASKGVPAMVFQMDDKTGLLLGVSSSLETAKQLGQSYKEKGLEFYAKPLTIREKTIKGSNKEKQFLNAATGYFQILSGASLNQELSGDLLTKMEDFEKSWAKEQSFGNKSATTLQKELLAATENLRSFYQSQNDIAFLKAQQNLLNFIIGYNSF